MGAPGGTRRHTYITNRCLCVSALSSNELLGSCPVVVGTLIAIDVYKVHNGHNSAGSTLQVVKGHVHIKGTVGIAHGGKMDDSMRYEKV